MLKFLRYTVLFILILHQEIAVVGLSVSVNHKINM